MNLPAGEAYEDECVLFLGFVDNPQMPHSFWLLESCHYYSLAGDLKQFLVAFLVFHKDRVSFRAVHIVSELFR